MRRARSFVLLVLPALLVVVESVDTFLRTTEAANSAERAAGLVDKHYFMYRARALEYSDASSARQRGEEYRPAHRAGGPAHTALAAIDAAVADSGRSSTTPAAAKPRRKYTRRTSGSAALAARRTSRSAS